jgi:shikimate kinase/3-dehydroquinate synthase
MSGHAKKHLLLNGCMGAGKTTVGRIVAGRAGVPFVDLDVAIAARAGRSVPTIFAEDGEAAFRALEAEVLEGVLAAPDPQVVALGGGALVDGRRRRLAIERASVVTLAARPETLASRTRDPGRPLLDRSPDRVGVLRDVLAARADAYAEAHATVWTDDVSPEGVADAGGPGAATASSSPSAPGATWSASSRRPHRSARSWRGSRRHRSSW